MFEQVCEETKPFYYRGCTFASQGWARVPNELVVFAYWDEEVAMELRNVPEFQENGRQLLERCTEPVQMKWFSGMITQGARSHPVHADLACRPAAIRS